MDVARSNAETVERLRARISTLQAAPRTHLAVLRTGVAAVDALLPAGGFPLGQVVELWGSAASGRTRLALRAVAEAHRALRLAAYVDGAGELYPPALAALGVNPARLLWVRRPGFSASAERHPSSQLGWAALQLLRSGAFSCVVLDLTHTGHRLSPQASKRLLDAAVHSGGLLLLLTQEETPGDGSLRLKLTAGPHSVRLEVVRSRQGMTARTADVPYEALGAWAPSPQEGGGLVPALQPTYVATAADKPFQRPRTSEVRNGLCGIQGQRPGRDLALPALGPGLGLR
jgi:recombination protein RecA